MQSGALSATAGRAGVGRRSCLALLASSPLLALPRPGRADESAWGRLARGGHVVLLRHAATTAGVGDPPEFKLDDCSTQRNLTDGGRAHARRVGAAFRARDVVVDRLLSSPWCRCVETARLAFERVPQTSGPLSNLFGKVEDREPQIRALRGLVTQWRGPGNIVMVSHGSTISALAGVLLGPAECVVVKPERDEDISVVGRLSVT